ncbi:hypothetical protein GCM10009539_05810 [Cryptosporangium japonicum]|uniref:Uncharacterized protein n=1 Tax=Cryptosporangium japonicum TaxID=80872 RepID=A0ABN0TJU2_9ACTN
MRIRRRARPSAGKRAIYARCPRLPLAYEVEGDRIKVSRATPWLSMDGARQIWEMGPDATPRAVVIRARRR